MKAAVPTSRTCLLSSDRGEIATLDVAGSFVRRLVGLLGRPRLQPATGLLFEDCRRVHTIAMRFSIDVVFVGSDGVVVGVESLSPGRVSARHRRGSTCIELPVGTAGAHGIEVGDRLRLTFK